MMIAIRRKEEGTLTMIGNIEAQETGIKCLGRCKRSDLNMHMADDRGIRNAGRFRPSTAVSRSSRSSGLVTMSTSPLRHVHEDAGRSL